MDGVTLNEIESDVTSGRYWNNFDDEPLGDISGWTYEVLSNPMAHKVEDDPYESGKTLFAQMDSNLLLLIPSHNFPNASYKLLLSTFASPCHP